MITATASAIEGPILSDLSGCLGESGMQFFYLFLGKLHYTILNYTSDYTLHLKLFKCTLYTLNYHTLHLGVTFTVKLD